MGRQKPRSTEESASLHDVRIDPGRAEALRRRKQRLILAWSLVLAALLLAALLLSALFPRASGLEAFSSCLSEQGAVLYGTDWCSHCQDQKRLFGAAFTRVAWVNCDYSALCNERNITGIPAWIFPDGTKLEGFQPLAVLAMKTGCELPDG